jgi:hypothetical protein
VLVVSLAARLGVFEIAAQSGENLKALQSVQVGAHKVSLKVESFNNFNCHIRDQRPQIRKDLLL